MTNGLWSTVSNWDVAPTAGADLVFPVGASNRNNTNDLQEGLAFGLLTIADDGYEIGGNTLTLSGPVVASYDTFGKMTLPMQLPGSTLFTVTNAGATLELSGSIFGAGGVLKNGDGTLILGGDNTYLGTTQVGAGTLVIQGLQSSSAVVVASGATVAGTGLVGAITSTGGTVRPGTAASGPGLLTSTGAVSFDAASTFKVVINGLVAGDDYSQLRAAGPVALGGATLDVSLNFVPTGQPSFLILDNTGDAPISGTFAGLAEGGTFSVSGQTFRITYVGGNGNDVELTRLIGSTTTLDAAPTASVYGQGVTLTATVAGAEAFGVEPAGTVEFFAGLTSLGTATIAGNQAVLTTTALPVGSQDVTARFLGDANYAPSESSAVTVAVAQASTTTALAVEPSNSVVGQLVTLTATPSVVSPGGGSVTGTVEFFAGATLLGSASIDAGSAVLQTGAIPLGVNTITARYLGNQNFEGSDSNPETVTVEQASTSTTVDATPNPAAEGELITLTAFVNVVSPGAGIASGTVEFFNGGVSLGTANVVAGTAFLQTSSLPRAANQITAQYLGNADFLPSTSDVLVVNVRLASTTTLAAVPASTTFGENVTLTATVAGADLPIPTGQVTFFAGATSLGTVDLVDGVAVLDSGALPAGTNSVTARYLGDEEYAPSLSNAVEVVVAQAATSTSLTADPAQAVFGQDVTLTAIVTVPGPGSGTPTGSVEFFRDGNSLGTSPLVGGQASLTTSGLIVGDNAITAQYLGDENFLASTSDPVSVAVAQASTTTTVTPSTGTAVFGQSVSLTATVTVVSPGAGEPSGAVEFFRDGVSLGIATLVGGQAVLNTVSLPVGTNAITAQYLGDANYARSTSAPSSVTVSQATTGTTVTTSPNPSFVGESVTLTATVAVASPGAGTPTGTVEFFRDGVSLGTATLLGNQAVLTTTALPVGSHAITAQYLGDDNFVASTSPAVTQQVNLVATTTTLTASNLTPAAFEPVTLTAAVASATGSLVPTGTVEFYLSGVLFGSSELVDGVATLTLASPPVGVESVTAVYLGSDSAASSTSNALTLVVGTDNERYVNQLYLSILGREADPQGLHLWSGALDRGRSRVAVAARIYNSREALGVQVQEAYQTYLGREATPFEVARTIQAAFKFGTNFAGVVLSSREYFRNVGGGTIAGYLNALANDVLGTGFTPGQTRFLASSLHQGKSTLFVVNNVLMSYPGRSSLVQQSFQTILGGPATADEVAGYLSIRNGRVTLRQIDVLLYASPEFYNQAIGASAANGRRRS